jgi:hypothetical protein
MFFSSIRITDHGCEQPPPGQGTPPRQNANSEKQAKDSAKTHEDCIKDYWTDRPVSQAIASANCKTMADPEGLDHCMMEQAKKTAAI